MILNREIISCSRCSRLIRHSQSVAKIKRKAFLDAKYWGKPVPNFGPRTEHSDVLVVGLAPAAHGANRTGRMFTGDRSGEWLYRALHRAGFASKAEAHGCDDGLELSNCTITNVVHCAPPDNKPLPKEIKNCEPFFTKTIESVQPKVILALGGIAWKAVLTNLSNDRPRFAHGAEHLLILADGRTIWLVGSYHPSQQNTFTGRLTQPLFNHVFSLVQKHLA